MNNKSFVRRIYDLTEIKAIPILDVCSALGLETVVKGNRHWCKLRDERTASTLLHTDPSRNNYYDFGTGESGDVISLVAVVTASDRDKAITFLGEAFSIASKQYSSNRNSFHLTNAEYKKIGLYGDLATKNFIFRVDLDSIDRITELSEKYAMSMSELRKRHPNIYERILRQKAIPFVKQLRNSYYFDVYYAYRSAQQYGYADLFYQTNESKRELDLLVKNLQTAERLLLKAAAGTSLKIRAVGEYDPAEDVQKILSGKIAPELGEIDYRGMQKEAKKHNTEVKFYKLSLSDYFSIAEQLSVYTTSGFLTTNDHVVIRYLQRDRDSIIPILKSLQEKQNKTELTQQIRNAEISSINHLSQRHEADFASIANNNLIGGR